MPAELNEMVQYLEGDLRTRHEPGPGCLSGHGSGSQGTCTLVVRHPCFITRLSVNVCKELLIELRRSYGVVVISALRTPSSD